MAVVTNKTLEFSEPLLEQLGIRHYFGMIIGADSGCRSSRRPTRFSRS